MVHARHAPSLLSTIFSKYQRQEMDGDVARSGTVHIATSEALVGLVYVRHMLRTVQMEDKVGPFGLSRVLGDMLVGFAILDVTTET